MIDCKGCPDKMKCITGEVKQCRRGLMLKRCCREYLTSRRKHLFKTILKMPEEMIKNNELIIEEVCRACGEKLNIRLKIKAGFDYETLKYDKIPMPEPYIGDPWTGGTGGTTQTWTSAIDASAADAKNIVYTTSGGTS